MRCTVPIWPGEGATDPSAVSIWKPASSALSFAIASSRGSPTYSAGSIGTVLEVGVALGVVGAVVGDVGGGVVGSGSVPLGCTAITMMMAMSATASSDTIAMS